ncbi:hypothetical protein CMO93_01040 [Candidatus Woesearchaeota archaeon]|nr:hypothetical protein [Candidatus Woesearchaeota archaeon]|tara:strand:- start:770 stop:1030 length:261 start_codon:yes stop_codon:yes gene_type:complete
MNTLTDERLEREFKVTKELLDSIKLKVDENHEHYKAALKFLDTAKRYYEDANHFKEKNDKASAFGALNYAFGWLDAGKEIGLFGEK